MELLTGDELERVTGVPLRTVRYYVTRGLLPAPVRRGRVAYYSADHVARLEVVRSLQDHGFTLQAIERFLAALPQDISAEDLAMQRAMITAWPNDPDAPGRVLQRAKDAGLSRETTRATREIIERHMRALAEELAELYADDLAPMRKVHLSPEDAADLEKRLPQLRELTLEAIALAFNQAVNDGITRSLTPSGP